MSSGANNWSAEVLPSMLGRSYRRSLQQKSTSGGRVEATGSQQRERASSRPDRESADHFAAISLHDIHNPLEAAANLAYLIREEADHPGVVREYVGLLEEQLSNITMIARQALSFYKQPKKQLNLSAVAEAALRVHDAKIRSKRLQLVQTLPKNAMVNGHAGDLLQVFCNLFANAIDALPFEGVLSLRIRRCESEIHVVIHDNGSGIPEDFFEEVFDPFFTTKGEKGTGLGLAMTKSIVQSHSGRIRMRSSTRPGRSGTAFRISLPRAATSHN